MRSSLRSCSISEVIKSGISPDNMGDAVGPDDFQRKTHSSLQCNLANDNTGQRNTCKGGEEGNVSDKLTIGASCIPYSGYRSYKSSCDRKDLHYK